MSRHANPLSIAVLLALVALAVSGLLGGVAKPVRVAVGDAARIEVHSPAIIRNGEFFEMQITVLPRRPIDDLVIGVTPGLWRDMTINTMIPAPAEESFERGAFRFSYGPAEPGKPLVVKIDAQINPSRFGGTAGRVSVADGDTPIAAVPIDMRILP